MMRSSPVCLTVLRRRNMFCQAVEKRASAALRLSFVFAAYAKVRLIPHDCARCASEHF
jgi:hypothetical protein